MARLGSRPLLRDMKRGLHAEPGKPCPNAVPGRRGPAADLDDTDQPD